MGSAVAVGVPVAVLLGVGEAVMVAVGRAVAVGTVEGVGGGDVVAVDAPCEFTGSTWQPALSMSRRQRSRYRVRIIHLARAGQWPPRQ